MLRNILCCIIWVLFLAHIHGQSVYMHEAQEEAMEQEKEGGTFTGIVGTILLFGIIYFLLPYMILEKNTKNVGKSI